VETGDRDQAESNGGRSSGDGDLCPDNGNSSPGDSDSPSDNGSSRPGNGDSPQTDAHVSPGGEESRCQADRLDTGGGTIGPQASHTGSGIETTGERLRVRLLIPRPVRIAFEEGLELCRAVEGRDVPVSDYVDALVAEASTGDFPAEADCLPILHRKTQAELEEVLEQTTEGWRQLETTPPANQKVVPEDPEAARMVPFLQQLIQGSSGGNGNPPNVFHEAIGGPDGNSSDGNGDRSNVLHPGVQSLNGTTDHSSEDNENPPNVLHGAIENPDAVIRQLLVLQDRCERQLGRLLARMTDQGAWRRLHFAGLGHYAEQRLGLARTSALERARLARGLRALPVVRQAYDDGRLGSVAALCLVRILDEEPPDEAVQRDWVERAARGTVKRLRDEHRELNRKQVNERSPRTYRQVSERSPRVCRPLTDSEWHRSLYREPGTARARIAQLGREATVLSFANTVFSVSLPEDLAAAFLSAIESARKSLQEGARGADAAWEQSTDGGSPSGFARALCEDRTHPASEGECGSGAPGEDASGYDEAGIGDSPKSNDATRASLAIARKLVTHGNEVPGWVGLLALIEEFVATWDVAQNPRRPSEDAVHRRDGWRCMAAGCTSRRNLQEHHVRYRSQGGSDELDNRLCVCAFHHQRGEHGDLASCRGMAPLGIEWSLGRGGRGGLFRNEMRVADLTGCMPGRTTPLLFDRL
jgi:hypothetical protein